MNYFVLETPDRLGMSHPPHLLVWKEILLPRLTDDRILGKLWVAHRILHQLIQTSTKSLDVNLPAIYSNTNPRTLITRSWGMKMLSILPLQRLGIWLPPNYQEFGPMVISSLPFQELGLATVNPTLKYFDTDVCNLENHACLINSADSLVKLLVQLSQFPELVIGSQLAQGIDSDITALLLARLTAAWQEGRDSRLVAFITSMSDLLRERLIANWQNLSTYTKEMFISNITSVIFSSPPLQQVRWVKQHFPHVTDVYYRDPTLYMGSENTTHVPFDLTILTSTYGSRSNLTRLTVDLPSQNSLEPLRLSLPATLLYLSVSTRWTEPDIDIPSVRRFLSNLPAGLIKFTFYVSNATPEDWRIFDIATVQALPRGLKYLAIPDLIVPSYDEYVNGSEVLKALPRQLTTLQMYTNNRYLNFIRSTFWTAMLSNSDIINLPSSLTSFTTLWKKYADPHLSVLQHFTNLTSLIIQINTITPTDLLELPDQVMWPPQLEQLTIHALDDDVVINSNFVANLPRTLKSLTLYMIYVNQLPLQWPSSIIKILLNIPDYVTISNSGWVRFVTYLPAGDRTNVEISFGDNEEAMRLIADLPNRSITWIPVYPEY